LHHPFQVPLPTGATIDSLVTYLGIPDALIAAVALNREAAELHTPLHDGDKVDLFPPVAGGRT